MSFLLDALRKSERSARERSAPSIHSTEAGGLQRIGRSELALHLAWILPALLLLVWLGLRQFGIFVDPEAERPIAVAGGIEGSGPARESDAPAFGDGRTPVEKLAADRPGEAEPGGQAARQAAKKAERDAAQQARRHARQAQRQGAKPAGKPSTASTKGGASTQAPPASTPAAREAEGEAPKPAPTPAARKAEREAATQTRRDARKAERAAKPVAKRTKREAATQARRDARQAEREAAKLAGKSSTASTQGGAAAPEAQSASTPAARAVKREAAKPVSEPVAEPPARPTVQPAIEPAAKPEPRPAPAPAPRENFIDYWQLPDNVRKQIPEISINVLVFAENPANRFILVNGARLIEGDALQPGLVLQEIRRDGAIFSYRNYRFRVTT